MIDIWENEGGAPMIPHGLWVLYYLEHNIHNICGIFRHVKDATHALKADYEPKGFTVNLYSWGDGFVEVKIEREDHEQSFWIVYREINRYYGM